MRLVPLIALTGAALIVAACSSPSLKRSAAPPSPAWSVMAATSDNNARTGNGLKPRIVRGRPGLQCVPYARDKSGIPIRGDAWTWWNSAKGKYTRSSRPAVGAVLVVGRTKKNRFGHLAVVTRILNDRELVVNHANWLNKGQIHLDSLVRDVSANNDWSLVKFWYTPGKVMGRSAYPVSGFILPRRKVAVQ